MKRSILFKTIFSVIGIIIVFVAAVFIFKTNIAASYLSSKLKTKVSIDKMSVSTTSLNISGFNIKNPTKELKNAFSAKELDVNYTMKGLKEDPSVIEEIYIDNAYLGVVCSNALCSNNNWTEIMHSIEKKKPSKKNNNFLIKRLIIRDLDVEIIGLGLNPASKDKLHFSHMEFNNIRSEEGFPTQQLVLEIFKSAGLNNYLKGFLEGKTGIEKFIDPFKELF